MGNFNINVNFDKKCKRCGKKGAVNDNICLECINKAIVNGEEHLIIKDLEDFVGQVLPHPDTEAEDGT